MKKKHLTFVLSMVLVAALSVGATLAYLTARDEVKNTFSVGKVNISLDEAKVDEYGEYVYKEDAEGNPTDELEARVKSNTYKLIPGHEYVKDPTVTVAADSEESYVRMIVTISNASELKAIWSDFLPQYFVDGWDDSIWLTTNIEDEDLKKNTLSYEFRYYETVSTVDAEAKELEALFTGINFPSEVTNAQLDTLEGLQINVEAHAIQADGFADADAAWAEFKK